MGVGTTGHWNDKVVVITGAGSGIGRALAHQFDARGARLVLSDIDRERVQATAAACRRATAHHLDVADRGAVRAHADQVVADLGRVDVVVNNAGVALAADVLEQSDEDIDWLLGTNLHGVISGTQAFLPHVVASRGHVVNISSVFGIVGMPSQSIYSAAKFGVRGYTEALAIEMDVAGTGVGVHCVHPGGIATNIVNFSRMAPSRDRQQLVDDLHRLFLRTSADAAARAIIRGVEANRRRILVGPDARVVLWGEKLLGSAYQRVVAAVAGRLLPAAVADVVVPGAPDTHDVVPAAAVPEVAEAPATVRAGG